MAAMADIHDASNASRSNATTVAVAADGVIIDWVTGLRAHVAARLRVPPERLNENVSWNLAEWGVDNPQEYLRGFLSSPMAARVSPIDDAAQGLAELRGAGFSVLAVTRRQHMVGDDAYARSKAREITAQWFENHPELGVGPSEVVFTADPVSVSADVWIDNAPGRVERLLKQNKPVWVMPQPWNRSVQTRPGVHILFDGWKSVDDLIGAYRT